MVGVDRPALRSAPGLVPALVVTLLICGNWALLMPVVPVAMTLLGASTAAASLNTAIFMAVTVLIQLVTPLALRAAGYRRVLAMGALFMGLPCPLMLLWTSPVSWYLIAALRGIGFGLFTVAGVSLVARLAPRAMLGQAVAAQGAAMAFAQAVGLGAGLLMERRWGFPTVIIIGFALAVAGCLVLVRVPGFTESAARRRPTADARDFSRRGAAIGLITLVATVFGCLTALVPIAEHGSAEIAAAALILISIGAIAGRMMAGRQSDNGRHGRYATAAPLVAGMGLAILALPGTHSFHVTALLMGAALFGFGYGVAQNDTMVSLFQLFGEGRRSTASKWSNVGFDLGTGIGALAFGAVASALSFQSAYFAAAVVLLLCAPLAWFLMRSDRATGQL